MGIRSLFAELSEALRALNTSESLHSSFDITMSPFFFDSSFVALFKVLHNRSHIWFGQGLL